MVGPLGGGGGRSVAIGQTPNIAARIQAEAEPGSVVVSDSLWRLLPGTFTAEPMGTRSLKGVDRPLELFKIITSGGQTAGLIARRTPFIGRAGQRALVREAPQATRDATLPPPTHVVLCRPMPRAMT